jgi:integrase
MSNTLNFTQATIEALVPAPTGKRAYHNDARVSGLQLQVTDKGVKTFYVYKRVKGRPKRIKLGRFPDLTPANARDQAKITIGQIAAGVDPSVLKTREAAERITLKNAFDEYLIVRTLKPKTVYNYTRFIEVAFPDWKHKRLARVSKDMVGKRHQRLGKEHGEAYANSAMRVFKAVYNFAKDRYEDDNGESVLPSNPVKRLSATRAWYREKRRDTYIEQNNLEAWFNGVLALKEDTGNPISATVADYLLLLIFTGLRRQEAATLQWDDVNLDNKTLTVKDTKNHENHTLPLSDYVHDMLTKRHTASDSDYVFPGKQDDAPLIEPRNYIAKVVKASGVPFILHDLRRTFLTYADSLDISAYALKRLVNHKMRNDVTAGYIVTDVERLRAPIQRITDYLLKAGKQRSTDVIPLSAHRQQESP